MNRSHAGRRQPRAARGREIGRWLLLSMIVMGTAACAHPGSHQALAQPLPAEANTVTAAPPTQVYFYPKSGQSAEQQDRDRYECHQWAVGQSGFDPSLASVPPQHRVNVVPVPPPGHDTAILGLGGAVLGAIVGGPRHALGGAVIGGVTGAAVGAASDASRQQTARQIENSYARSDQAKEAQLAQKSESFRRAMSACLEGRGYSVQ